MNLLEVPQLTWMQTLGDLSLGVFLFYCIQNADAGGRVMLTTLELEALLSTSRNTFRRWIDKLVVLELMSLTVQNGSSTGIQLNLETLGTLLESPQSGEEDVISPQSGEVVLSKPPHNGEVGPQSGEVPPQNGEISPQSGEVARIEDSIISNSLSTIRDTTIGPIEDSINASVDSTIGPEDSKNSALESEEEKKNSSPPPEKKKKASKKSPKSEKPKFYDFEFYENKYDEEAFDLARTELKFPYRESAGTALIAAYLIGLQTKHGIPLRISGDEFGRIRGGGGKCCAFFTEECNGDEIEGFVMALAYVRWFILHEQGSYIAGRAYPLSLLFNTETYRTFAYMPKKKLKKDRWQSQNNNGRRVITEEDRLSRKAIVI